LDSQSGFHPLLAAAPAPAVYPAPRWQSVRVGPRPARDAELELFLATQVRAQREPPKSKTEVPASRMLPQDLGVWRPTLEFLFGPLALGKDLNEVSACDLARAAERAGDAFDQQGYGVLLARLAGGLSIRRSDHDGVGQEHRSGNGRIFLVPGRGDRDLLHQCPARAGISSSSRHCRNG
jgi:hypothetical protein